MHFHDKAVCTKCRARAQYSTPIAEELILSAFCFKCMSLALIGRWETGDCTWCLRLRRDLDNQLRENLKM